MDNLTIQENSQANPSVELLDSLTEQYGSSYYLFNKNLFAHNLCEFRASFEQFYSNVKLGYSYKTNYMPAACQIARKEGAYAEVVSGLEYALALEIGYEGSDIIFNGPLKEKDELIEAFKNDSIIHFDSYEEIKILKEYLKENNNSNIRCALRCNFDIGEDEISRFGFDVQGGDAEEVYKELFALTGCNPIGIHCHFSTNHRSIESYQMRTAKLIGLAKRIFKKNHLQYVDIGGGFFGEMPERIQDLFSFNPPSFAEYGQAVGKIMRDNFPDEKIELVVEPGASVVANTMCFICQVASIKQIQSKPVVTLTGGTHNVRPTGSGGKVPFRVIKATNKSNELKNALVGGYTCMETDIIDKSFDGDLSMGDYLIFDNMGAYNIVFKPPFIKEAPPILMYGEEDRRFQIIRKRETLDELFSSYKF